MGYRNHKRGEAGVKYLILTVKKWYMSPVRGGAGIIHRKKSEHSLADGSWCHQRDTVNGELVTTDFRREEKGGIGNEEREGRSAWDLRSEENRTGIDHASRRFREIEGRS